MSCLYRGPGLRSRYSDLLRAGWSGVRDFPHASKPNLGPTQPPVQWVPGFSPGLERQVRDFDHVPPPPTVAEAEGRVPMLPLYAFITAGYRVNFTFVVFMIWIIPGWSAFGTEFCGTQGEISSEPINPGRMES